MHIFATGLQLQVCGATPLFYIFYIFICIAHFLLNMNVMKDNIMLESLKVLYKEVIQIVG